MHAMLPFCNADMPGLSTEAPALTSHHTTTTTCADEDYESDGASEGNGTSGTSLLGFLGTMGTKLKAMGGSSRSRRQAAGEDDGTSSTSSTRSGTAGTGREQQGGSSRTSRTSSTRRNVYAADGAESNNGTAGTRGTGRSVLKSGWLRDAVNDQAAQLQALLSNQTEAVSEQKMVLSRLRQQVVVWSSMLVAGRCIGLADACC